ncbi:MAG: hypothetical protein AB8G86_12110 [Saprospiraceae bacterium]
MKFFQGNIFKLFKINRVESWLLPGSYRVIQLEKIAKKTSFSFTPKDEFGILNLLKDFRLFQLGGAKSIVNILRDNAALDESDFQVFDYQYTISDGENALNYPQTVFFAQSKKLALPPFSIRPPHFFNHTANYLNFGDINEEASPLFSDQFMGGGETRRQLHKNLSAEMLHFFTTEKDWNVEGFNYYMIFYKKNKVLPTTEILDFLEKGKQLVEMFSRTKRP